MDNKTEPTPILLINHTDHHLELPVKISATEIKNEESAAAGTVSNETKKDAKEESIRRIKLNLKVPAQKPGTKKMDNILVIEAHSAVRTNRNNLEIYDYEPFVQKGELSIIEEEKPESIYREYIIVNKTAHKIGIPALDNSKQTLVISAFGSRRISLAAFHSHDFKSWENLNFIDIIPEDKLPEEKHKTAYTVLLVWAVYGWLFVLFLKWMNLDKHFGDATSTFSFSIWLIWPIGAIVTALVYLFRNIIQKEGFKKGVIRLKKASALFRKNLNELANMTILVLWPVIVPVAVILFFGGILEYFTLAINDGGLNFDERVLFRLLQLLFIIILSILPGMLYYQYERRKIESVRIHFIRNIMHLNPLLHTTDDAETKYGNLIDEITFSAGFGSKKFSILRTGRPLLLATALITLCWIYTFWPVGDISDISLNHQIIFSEVAQMNLVNFAFLGAYFFAINLLFKRYSRGDLSPKAYSHISIRIISAIILVWIIGIAFTGSLSVETETSNNENGGNINIVVLYIMAFGIGLVPETGITMMKQILESRTLRKIFPNFRPKHPITDLGGVSLYDKARLTEEGVESVETLAHHDMIELMLRSGIPVARIVDLVDQAILYLHAVDIICDAEKSENNRKTKKGLEVLKNEGIRTATDLIAAENAVTEHQKSNDAEIRKRYNPEVFYKLLDSGPKHSYRMQRLLDTLKDDEWLAYVQNWRNTGLCAEWLVTDPREILEKGRFPKSTEKAR